MLELIQRGLAALDVHADIVGLDQLLDGIGQLTATPVFQAMHRAALAGDKRLIALDHGGHLLALVGVNDEHYFVVTHVWTP
ncbi:Uncharacterised protein [Bordetella pertussis]|nr:Uncharacterised protein [Bordetella pertussis]CPI19168.1 Uncharacterised protein [Bordetella pertussis]